LDGPLGFDGGDSGIDILRDHITTIGGGGGEGVSAMVVVEEELIWASHDDDDGGRRRWFDIDSLLILLLLPPPYCYYDVPVHETAGHILAMAGVTLSHHIGRLKHTVGDLSH